MKSNAKQRQREYLAALNRKFGNPAMTHVVTEKRDGTGWFWAYAVSCNEEHPTLIVGGKMVEILE